MELYHIIRKVIDNRGLSCITERTFLHCLDDEQVFHNVNTHAYRHVLQLMITNGYTQRLLQIGHWNTESKTLATSFAQQEAIRTEVATYLFHCLAYGLRWSQTAPILQAPSVPAPTPSKTKASGKKTPTQPDKRVAELEQKLKAAEQNYKELQKTTMTLRTQYDKSVKEGQKATKKINTLKKQNALDAKRVEDAKREEKRDRRRVITKITLWIVWLVASIVSFLLFGDEWYDYLIIASMAGLVGYILYYITLLWW